MGFPEHPLADGVTVMVAVAVVEPVLVAVKEGTLPDPLDARPIEVLLLVQVKVVPDTAPLNEMTEVVAPLQ